MNDEDASRIAKRKATIIAQRTLYDSQTIKVDDHWRIIRTDEYNWEVQKDYKFMGYYSNLSSAIRSLHDKIVDSEAKNSLADFMELNRAIVERIETAIKSSRK